MGTIINNNIVELSGVTAIFYRSRVLFSYIIYVHYVIYLCVFVSFIRSGFPLHVTIDVVTGYNKIRCRMGSEHILSTYTCVSTCKLG